MGCRKKAVELGAKVVTLSGPDGFVYDENGVSGEKIDYMLSLRYSGNDVVSPYAERFENVEFYENKNHGEMSRMWI